MELVTNLYAAPLGDIPARLRVLADEIEQGDGAKACIVLVDWIGETKDYGVQLLSMGRDADPLRTLGILHVAQAEVCNLVNQGPVDRISTRDG